MKKEQFVYVTYIRTTPEKLWKALIEPEFTRAILGQHNAGIRMETGRIMEDSNARRTRG